MSLVGPGTGGSAKLLVNGQKFADDRTNHIAGNMLAGDVGAETAMDEATNVADVYKKGDNRFTGRVHKFTMDLKKMRAASDQGLCRGLLVWRS